MSRESEQIERLFRELSQAQDDIKVLMDRTALAQSGGSDMDVTTVIKESDQRRLPLLDAMKIGKSPEETMHLQVFNAYPKAFFIVDYDYSEVLGLIFSVDVKAHTWVSGRGLAPDPEDGENYTITTCNLWDPVKDMLEHFIQSEEEVKPKIVGIPGFVSYMYTNKGTASFEPFFWPMFYTSDSGFWPGTTGDSGSFEQKNGNQVIVNEGLIKDIR